MKPVLRSLKIDVLYSSLANAGDEKRIMLLYEGITSLILFWNQITCSSHFLENHFQYFLCKIHNMFACFY